MSASSTSSSMTSALDRVTALLDRAGHEGTPEEEARTSAVLAARMIRQHGLVVVMPEPARGKRTPRYRGTSRASPSRDDGPSHDNHSPFDPYASANAASGARRRRPPTVDFDPFDGELVGRRTVARYPGRCKDCRRGFREGDPVIWVPGDGARHPECWDELAEPW